MTVRGLTIIGARGVQDGMPGCVLMPSVLGNWQAAQKFPRRHRQSPPPPLCHASDLLPSENGGPQALTRNPRKPRWARAGDGGGGSLNQEPRTP